MYPLYGMAEATLLISAGRRGNGPIIRTVSRDAFQRHQIATCASSDDAHRVVGCGRNIVGQRIAIVDPETRRRLEGAGVEVMAYEGSELSKGDGGPTCLTCPILRA